MAEQKEEYVGTLDEASLKKAREELNEDPADRMNAVEAFRNLIKTRAPHIRCSMDTSFLLRFLRVAKFSQPEALRRLERYLEIFNSMEDWIRDIDMMDPEIQTFLDEGFWLDLGHDDEGSPINMFTFGAYDPSFEKYSKTSMFRAQIGILIYRMWDERSQVNGFKGFGDLTSLTIKHQLAYGVSELQRMAHIMDGAMPIQWKNIYYYNHGPIWEAIMNIFKPFLSNKMRDRLFFCGSNMEVVYEKGIAKKHLPREFLPDEYTGPCCGTKQDLIKNLKAELSKPEVVARIKYETSDAFRLDESKRPKDLNQ